MSPASAADQVRLTVDDRAPESRAAPLSAWVLENLPAGAHIVHATLLDGAGAPYAGADASDAVRFYLSRLCAADAACCVDDRDCNDLRWLDACSDPDGRGHGLCAGRGADPTFPETGTCAYPTTDPDVCVHDGGHDARGVPFPPCAHDLDLDADGVADCCTRPVQCDDGDPATIDGCDLRDDGEGPGLHRCWHENDPEYCGPGGASPTCDDGDPGTRDLCCAGVEDPHGACARPDGCVHVRDPGCCQTAADCVDGLGCTTDACVDGICRHEEVAAGCCETNAGCPAHPDPCRANVCLGNACVAIELPGCCTDDDPTGPDASCDDVVLAGGGAPPARP